MSTNQQVKNYHPIRFLGGRGHQPKEPVPAQPQTNTQQLQNRSENTLNLPSHFQRNTKDIRRQSQNKSHNTSEGSSSRNINSDYLAILDNMDKKIKELMREAAGLMQMLLNQQTKLQFDEKMQEGLRLMDDKDIEKEYKLLKDKLKALRNHSILQGNQPKKYQPYFTVPNPEVINDKTRKLHQEKVLDFKVDPNKQHQRSSSARKESSSASKVRLDVSKEKAKGAVPENGRLTFAQSDHLSKRAQHYKQKSLKLQQALELLLAEKDATDRINEEMSQELVVLRAQTLSLRYQYQKKD